MVAAAAASSTPAQSYPTRQPGADEYNVDPEKLPISKDLADGLNAWGDGYDATPVRCSRVGSVGGRCG